MQAQMPVSQDNDLLPAAERRGVLGPVMSSLGWPIIVGLVAYWAFLFFLQQGWIASEWLMRYLSAHPVSYVATAMFFVGVASLLIKLLSVIYQINDRRNVRLSTAPSLAQRADTSRYLLEELRAMPVSRQESYLGRRLRNALQTVHKTNTANGLEDELKYLAEIDAEKQQESYALTRILIWAIPMLGFLGTVIGISGALGGLSVEADFNTMLTGLKQKLYVAFDTTALALTLSIGMMFAQFVVNRIETQLLTVVDEAASAELTGRFITFGTSRDPYLASVQKMSEQVLSSISEISSQQSAVWDRGLKSVEQATELTLGQFAEVLADRLAKQLNPIMDEFGTSLRGAISDTSNFMEHHSKELGEAIQHSTESIKDRNEELGHSFSAFTGEFKNVVATHSEGLKQSLAESDQALGARLHRFHQLMEQTFDAQSETLEKGISDSDKILSHYLQQISQMTKQAAKLVEGQSEQLAEGIENSRKFLHANSVTLKQSIESANQVMDSHSEQLEEVVMAASQAMDNHAQKIADAVTQSEGIVDRRQETIAKTQESMLKAQAQQTMAISNFNEKLQVLGEIIEQSGSLEQMQTTLAKTITDMDRSDTIANEIKGLAKLVKDQIRSSDQHQLALSQTSEKQLGAVIAQTQAVFQENAELLSGYQRKTDELVSTLLQAGQTDHMIKIQQSLEESFNVLSMQLVSQNQTLSALGEQIQSSWDLDSWSSRVSSLLVTTMKETNENADLAPQLGAIVEKLEMMHKTFEKPTEHQQKFLSQQKQTIENQNQLLEFCQGIEGNNRSAFLDSAHKILEEHAKSAAAAVKLEATVRELAFSVNLLNQSLSSHANKAAEETLQLGKPDIPQRVA